MVKYTMNGDKIIKAFLYCFLFFCFSQIFLSLFDENKKLDDIGNIIQLAIGSTILSVFIIAFSQILKSIFNRLNIFVKKNIFHISVFMIFIYQFIKIIDIFISKKNRGFQYVRHECYFYKNGALSDCGFEIKTTESAIIFVVWLILFLIFKNLSIRGNDEHLVK